MVADPLGQMWLLFHGFSGIDSGSLFQLCLLVPCSRYSCWFIVSGVLTGSFVQVWLLVLLFRNGCWFLVLGIVAGFMV